MAAESPSHIYLARNMSGVLSVAMAPVGLDPVAEKLYWFLLHDLPVDEYLHAIGYEPTKLRSHPSINNLLGDGATRRLQFGKTVARSDSLLVNARGAANIIHSPDVMAKVDPRINTFRVHSRRGRAPKPYEDGKLPKWVAAEVDWWAAHRTGQGNRTDKTVPLLEHAT